ncbi:MAG: PAS domain S-box protein, partial [Salinarchaeum sp.]
MERQDDTGATVHLNIDALTAVTLLHDADGDITAVNQEAVDQLGYPRAHLRAMTVEELLVEAEDWPPETDLPKNAQGQSIRHHDGTILDGEITLRPLEAPEPYLLQLRFEDVSDPARSPRRVAQYQAILDELEYAVYATDADWQIEYVNPAFEDLFGYNATEAIGKDVEALLASGEHEDSFYADLRSTIEAGHRWDGEVINETGTGDTTRVHVTILPVDVADSRSFIALAEDVTGAYSTQRLQQERRTLQMLNQAMQHDIETDLERVQEAVDQLRNRGLVADTEQFTQLTTAASDVLRTVDQARSTIRAVIERESPLRPLRIAPT